MDHSNSSKNDNSQQLDWILQAGMSYVQDIL